VDDGYQSTPVLPGQETGRGKKNGGDLKGCGNSVEMIEL